MYPLCSSSFKRSREKGEGKQVEKRTGRSRAKRSMDKTRSLSIPASPKETVGAHQRDPPTLPKILLVLRLFPQFNIQPPNPFLLRPIPLGKKKKKYFTGPDDICKVNRKELEKDLFRHKKALLGPLFIMFPVTSRTDVITCVRDTRGGGVSD